VYSLIPEGTTRRDPSADRQAARRAHAGGEAGGGDLRDRQSAQPRRRADQLTDEREQLAELNLIAAKRASRYPYASALTYLTAGAALLPEDSRERRHELTFALELNQSRMES